MRVRCHLPSFADLHARNQDGVLADNTSLLLLLLMLLLMLMLLLQPL
jgi:hypothetical protein